MISIQHKRRYVLLIAVALIAVMLLAGGLPDMVLSPGAPFPGSSGGSSTAEYEAGSPQYEASHITWIFSVSIIVFLGLSIYIGVNLARKAPYKKILQGIGIGILILAILSSFPAQVNNPSPQLNLEEPELEVTPVGSYEVTELGRPPASFVRTVIVALVGLAIFVLLWLLRQSINHEGIPDKLRNDAELALADLHAGQDIKNVIIRCYLQMQRDVAMSKGLEPEAWLTPREFQEQMIALGMPPSPTGQLTHLFEEVRYGHKSVDAQEEQLAMRCLSELALSTSPGK